MTNTTTNPAGETPAHPGPAHLLRHDFLRSYGTPFAATQNLSYPRQGSGGKVFVKILQAIRVPSMAFTFIDASPGAITKWTENA